MKIAISIPDNLKKAADQRAAELGTSRSAVFSEAMRFYLLHTDTDRITAALDAVHGELATEMDDLAAATAADVLAATDW